MCESATCKHVHMCISNNDKKWKSLRSMVDRQNRAKSKYLWLS